jgi:hypothetical protein
VTAWAMHGGHASPVPLQELGERRSLRPPGEQEAAMKGSGGRWPLRRVLRLVRAALLSRGVGQAGPLSGNTQLPHLSHTHTLSLSLSLFAS